jgi:hypothetical protein
MCFSAVLGMNVLQHCLSRQRAWVPTKDSDARASPAAVEHGKLRRMQGYTSAMIHESRILQVTIFGTLHANLIQLDFNLLLPAF